jgi:hypothetical protein
MSACGSCRPEMSARRSFSRGKRTLHEQAISVAFDPTVWTGRALQAESAEWQRLVLLFCIRPLRGADSSLAIMDIRARPISF